MSNYPKVNYIGNKEKLVEWIIDEMPVKKGTVVDIFAGGCSVSYALKEKGYSVIANDILYADFVIGKGLVENSERKLSIAVFDKKVDETKVDQINEQIEFLSGRLYYPNEVRELAQLIAIADKLKSYEKYLFLSLVRRAMIRKLPYSRMNVPWDQIQRLRDEEYSYRKYKRRRAYHNQTFKEHMLENFEDYNNAVFKGECCKVYNCDAFELIKKLDKVDVVYMDPPYPSTMNNYDNFYGLFDEMFGKKRLHADFTQKNSFLETMEKLVEKLVGKTKYIVLSQNTRVQPGPDEIKEMLEKFGAVEIKEKRHNYQVTGKENKNASKELLFVLTMEE